MSFLSKKTKALFRFYFKPCGGSLVSLMDLSSKPIGIESAGSEETKSRKVAFEPSVANPSSFFSSSMRKTGIK